MWYVPLSWATVTITAPTFVNPDADPDRARTITFAAHKGGTGRTTALANIGAEAARMGAQVLMIDFDANAVLTTAHMGVDTSDESTAADVILDGTTGCAASALLSAPDAWQPRTDLPWRNGGAMPGTKGAVAFIPGGLALGAAAEQLISAPASERRLSRALSGVARHFDLVLIDTGANIMRLNWITMHATGSVLVVFPPEDSALGGVTDQIGFTSAYADAYDLPVRVIGNVCSKFDRRSPATHRDGLARIVHAVEQLPPTRFTEPIAMEPLLPGEDPWVSDGLRVWPDVIEQRAAAQIASANRAPLVSQVQQLGEDGKVPFAIRKEAETATVTLGPIQRIALRLLQGVGSPMWAPASTFLAAETVAIAEEAAAAEAAKVAKAEAAAAAKAEATVGDTTPSDEQVNSQ